MEGGTIVAPARMTTSPSQRLWSLQHRLAPYLFVLPFVVLFCVFLLYPLARSFYLSLFHAGGTPSAEFIGLGHYRFILSDPIFWLACANTIAFAVLFLSIQVPASLALAMLLNSRLVRFRELFRFAFFSSHVVGAVFVAVLFRLLMAPRQGIINKAIDWLPFLGSDNNWLGDPVLARPAVVIAALWLSVGWGMVYLLAALQAVDPELYEAAEVDGAGPWSRFRHVTLPGIRPVLAFLVLVGTIAALSLFELPYVFFQGSGPKLAGMTIVMYLYENGFMTGDISFAAAVGWILVVMMLGVSLVQVRLAGAAERA
jgi:ABC-type sugar transport system permease subunit